MYSIMYFSTRLSIDKMVLQPGDWMARMARMADRMAMGNTNTMVQLLKFALSVLRLYYLYSMDKFSDAFRLSGINVTIFRLHVHSLLDLWFADWLHRPAAASETETTDRSATCARSEVVGKLIRNPHISRKKNPVLGQFQVPEIPIGPRTASFYFVRTIYGSIKVDWCWPWWSLPSILFWGYQKSQRCRPPEPNSNEVGRVYARWVFGWRRMLTYSHDFTCIHSTSIIDLWFQKTITNLSFLLRLRCYIFLEIMGRSRVVDSQTAGSAGLPARQSAVVIGVIGVLKSLESLQFQIDGDADWPWL